MRCASRRQMQRRDYLQYWECSEWGVERWNAKTETESQVGDGGDNSMLDCNAGTAIASCIRDDIHVVFHRSCEERFETLY